jgi:hypothetical protein
VFAAAPRWNLSLLPCDVSEEVNRLPRLGTEIVLQRYTDRIAPRGASGREIDLSRSRVRNTGNSMAGVKGLPAISIVFTMSSDPVSVVRHGRMP